MTMAKQAWESLVAFKLVWVRVVLYVGLPIIATFLALTKDVDDAKWSAFGRFARAKLYMESISPGLVALAAFIDQSMARAKNDIENKRTGHTQFLNRPDTGP